MTKPSRGKGGAAAKVPRGDAAAGRALQSVAQQVVKAVNQVLQDAGLVTRAVQLHLDEAAWAAKLRKLGWEGRNVVGLADAGTKEVWMAPDLAQVLRQISTLPGARLQRVLGRTWSTPAGLKLLYETIRVLTHEVTHVAGGRSSARFRDARMLDPVQEGITETIARQALGRVLQRLGASARVAARGRRLARQGGGPYGREVDMIRQYGRRMGMSAERLAVELKRLNGDERIDVLAKAVRGSRERVMNDFDIGDWGA